MEAQRVGNSSESVHGPFPIADRGGRGEPAMAVMREVVRSGAFARLSLSAKAVISVYWAHANMDLESWPGAELIAQEAGVTARSVARSRRELVERGLLLCLDDGGGRVSGRYRVITAPVPGRAGQMNHASAVSPPLTPCHPTPDRRAGAPLTQCQGTPDRRAGGIEEIEKNRSTTTSVRADSAVPCAGGGNKPSEPSVPRSLDPSVPCSGGGLFDAPAAVELLVERGFRASDAGGLVREYGAARIVEAVANADFLQRKGEIRKSYRGALVGFLRGGYASDPRIAAEKKKREAALEAKAAAAERQRMREREREQEATAQAADAALWDSLTPEVRQQLRGEVLAGMSEAQRRVHDGLGVEHPALRALVLAQAKSSTAEVAKDAQ